MVVRLAVLVGRGDSDIASMSILYITISSCPAPVTSSIRLSHSPSLHRRPPPGVKIHFLRGAANYTTLLARINQRQAQLVTSAHVCSVYPPTDPCTAATVPHPYEPSG